MTEYADNVAMPSSNLWSVDDIAQGKFIHPQMPEHALVRLVHVVDKGAGGTRYVLARNDCIDVVTDRVATDDQSSKLFYGRVYALNNRALREAVDRRDSLSMDSIGGHNLH